ncbi:unnamed protein product [Triticum turgidum subsp. durum]|uniref:Uncharacterized protein n=1 Tax=Triticum turgidum subsp. durum TaxID=4567 RepID=A0A9R1AM57_TRITD|nr:unnamed protein product [Triticum turgidum subsp. durum]
MLFSLKHCFFSTASRDELFLNLVMEYVLKILYRMLKNYSNAKQGMPLIYVKLYTYQGACVGSYCSWSLPQGCEATKCLVLLFVAITLHTIRQNKATKVYKYTTRSMLYVYVCMDRCY